MSKRLFLLDGMALLYRAHFALIKTPIRTSDGLNTSALYGFANVLLDIIKNQTPTHLAVALDTSAPTPRHEMFPEYKAQRQEMPEDIAMAIPHIKRLLEAMNIPLLVRDGYEADDIMGILSKRADQEDFDTFLVTPDKDFGQLVSERTKIYKPGRQGSDVEILGVAEVCAKWGIERPEQVIDILALMGDAVDNIPGVPGIGEKTAASLIQQFGSVENLVANAAQLKGKQKEKIEQNVEKALLSKRLATIMHDAPFEVTPEELAVKTYNDEALKALLMEFEFNALGRRLYGDEFRAGRGRLMSSEAAKAKTETSDDLFSSEEPPLPQAVPAQLRTIADTEHQYHLVRTKAERAALLKELHRQKGFCFDIETTSLDPHDAVIVGIAFAWKAHEGWFVLFPRDKAEGAQVLEEFRSLFEECEAEKVAHNMKFDLSVLLAYGVQPRECLFDPMLAHSLIDPEQRHNMDFLAEAYLGYTPIPITAIIGTEKDLFGMA
ncbi:MAG TPA: 5'-3' exonuclease H3TH domain-containing protein, partial [Prosthecobacter sp.]|nr:5'-3' exonuclease H3TH domain-containing protein [Prosthecobacter sp.]